MTYVPCIPQESTNTCWAAAMAMLLESLSGIPRRPAARSAGGLCTGFTPRYVAEQAGLSAAYESNGMLTSVRQSFTQLAAPWGLVVESNPANPTSSEWSELLLRDGPVFVNLDLVRNHHSVIVSNIDGHSLTIVDPWPVGHGSFYQREVNSIPSPIHTMIHGPATRMVLQPSRGCGA